MAIKTGSTLYLLKIFSFAWYGEFKLLFKRKTKFSEVSLCGGDY